MKDQTKSFSIKKIAILVTILALPGFCYYLLQEKGENRYKSLPFYGEKKLTGTFHTKRGKQIPDTLYHAVQPFSMLNSDSSTVTFKPDSSVAVINFFFTKKEKLAKPINQVMQQIAKRFEKNAMVELYSVSIDPYSDTPSVLKQYKEGWGKFRNWYMLSPANYEEVITLAKDGLLLDVVYDPKAHTPVTHSSSIVLLDSKRRIRGYYDALVKTDVDKLIDEIKLLLTEEFRNISIRQ
ncbi:MULTISPECIES: SCO family protein [Olivibacter]|jgi:protein SCO1/2|uniref:SCO family protein n=1 Tax=Olivibacter oleidegradans TaxID=760123 RepID=A0ABV6HFI0_9SPHI|nr:MULTISPECIES: SCO family protein [Olivibacter]MCL4639787.1 SCO family protein [Olivibacter sp. UJ_SKK_5.1]MDM8177050.1 SCO family protein [Olivibacter sp. 47]MDX3912418.1 SCO family protein [Pseudosphingobacterium sp.]QEL00139.1 SCO family protein [Olivibacter sp. LS-1]